MGERRRAGAIATVMAVVGLAACSPGPTPASTPSPTGFSSDAEAFAAAEATYRAYVDAVNSYSRSSEVGAVPLGFLIDSALEGELQSRKDFEERGIKLVGDLRIDSMTLIDANLGSARLRLFGCFRHSCR